MIYLLMILNYRNLVYYVFNSRFNFCVLLYPFLNDGNEIIKRQIYHIRAYIKTQSTREKFLYKLDRLIHACQNLTTSRQKLLIRSFSDFIGRKFVC